MKKYLDKMEEFAKNGLCPFCGKEPNFQDFDSVKSVLIFDKTKVCQECQNSFLYDLRNFQREISYE
jgi:hypothetical protein